MTVGFMVTQKKLKKSWSKFNRNLKGFCFSAGSELRDHWTLAELVY